MTGAPGFLQVSKIGPPMGPNGCDFQPTHAGLKTAKSSPVGPHRAADLGNVEKEPGTPVIGQGVDL